MTRPKRQEPPALKTPMAPRLTAETTTGSEAAAPSASIPDEGIMLDFAAPTAVAQVQWPAMEQQRTEQPSRTDDYERPEDMPPEAPQFVPKQFKPTASRAFAQPKGTSALIKPEAEEMLLGAIFIDAADALAKCAAANLGRKAFVDERHAIVFACARDLWQRGIDVEPPTVAEELKSTQQLEAIGGYPMLVQLSQAQPTTAQTVHWIDKVAAAAAKREFVRLAEAALEQARDPNSGAAELATDFRSHMERLASGTSGHDWSYRSFADFTIPAADDADALLGKYRFLCRGGGLVIAGPTGIGKSSIDFQSAVCWALGRDFLGIPCTRPLKSLIIGSEDDDGDIAEVWASLAAGMKLTDEEVSAVRKRVIYHEERVEAGESFLRSLKRAVGRVKKSEDPFDLVRLNPLLAFTGCAVSDQKEMGAFLRSGLNGVNADKRFAYIISHHTNKPPAPDGKQQKDRNWNEWAYAMSGSAEIANWARAVIAIEPLKDEGRFVVRLAKRGKRAGVMRETRPADEYGPATFEVVTSIYARHAKERVQLDASRSIPMIFWRQDTPPAGSESATEPKQPGPKRRFSFAEFRPAFVGECPTYEKRAGFARLYRAALNLDGTLKKSTFNDLLKEAVDDGFLVKADDGKGYHLP